VRIGLPQKQPRKLAGIYFFLAGLFLVSLAACMQLPWMQALPSLPPTIAIPTEKTSSALPGVLKETATPTPVAVILSTATPSETALDLSTDDIANTQAAEEALAEAQTQAAILASSSSSAPTPCPNARCPSPTPTLYRWVSRTPTITPTPTLSGAFLNIMRPGPLSKVVSPIQLEAAAHAGANGTIRVELIGEDGQAIVRKILLVGDQPYMSIYLSTSIAFEISTVSQAGRLQISIDDQYKRPVALSSVDLILLSMGSNARNLPGDGLEPFIILQPKPDQVISGNKLVVQGLARPLNSTQPLIVKLVTESGTILGTKSIYVIPQPDGGHSPFSVEFPISVTEAHDTRVIISQDGDHIPGVAALSSVDFTLMP